MKSKIVKCICLANSDCGFVIQVELENGEKCWIQYNETSKEYERVIPKDIVDKKGYTEDDFYYGGILELFGTEV